jgi:hypothetical protein
VRLKDGDAVVGVASAPMEEEGDSKPVEETAPEATTPEATTEPPAQGGTGTGA